MDSSSESSDWAAPRTSLADWPSGFLAIDPSRAALLPWESIAGDLIRSAAFEITRLRAKVDGIAESGKGKITTASVEL